MRPMQRALAHKALVALQLQEKKGLLRKNLELHRKTLLATSVFDGKERVNEWLQTAVPQAAFGNFLSSTVKEL